MKTVLRKTLIDDFPRVCNIVFYVKLATTLGLLIFPIDSTILLTRFDLKSTKLLIIGKIPKFLKHQLSFSYSFDENRFGCRTNRKIEGCKRHQK